MVEADDGIVGASIIKKSVVAKGYGAIGCSFDVVLMNNVMKGISGPLTAHNMREAGFDGIILGLMHHPRQKDRDHFRECGADGVLEKVRTVL